MFHLRVQKLIAVMALLFSIIATSAQTNDSYSFIENQGQFDGRNWDSDNSILFGYDHKPYYIFLGKRGMTYRFDKIVRNPSRDKSNPNSPKRTNISEIINIEWLNANTNYTIKKENKVAHSYNYAMRTGKLGASTTGKLDGYEKVTYENLYNSIDLIFEIHPQSGIKYSFKVHPGGNPADIQFRYSGASTNLGSESISLELTPTGELEIKTSLGEIIEHKPEAFLENGSAPLSCDYNFSNNLLTFNVGAYNTNQTLIIDPWVVSPTFPTSSAVWEVETDAAGNVYTIGGESPMQLKKHDAAGNLLWTYSSPWDTSTVWLGTLATDDAGVSYITSGTTPEIQRIDNNGNMVWHNTSGGGFGADTEYWTISFNCDKTKLIVGGTKFVGLTDVYAAIFEMDITNGNVVTDQTFAYTNLFGGGIGTSPEEVRAISPASNAKFIYLTHNQVGAINQNFNTCPNNVPTFQVNNTHNLGYKCEDYLPETQNGGGLKALVANDNFFYTHSGSQIHQWDLNTGAQITSVNLPGGGSTTVPLIGGIVVECSGLAVDDCGNVYAGSKDRVVKFDANLNILSSSNTTFSVYDVSVNNNGEVLAVGAQQNNAAVNRNGRIESLAMSACAQYSTVCCDASFCALDTLCQTDAAVNLIANTSGGTWSGNGVSGSTFDPAVAGPGVHTITYTLVCGTESIDVVVSSCVALTACLEANGDVTVTSGTGPFTWYEFGSATSTPITNQTECQNCGYTWQGFPLNQCLNGFTPVTSCNSPGGWSSFGNGTTVTPPSYPIYVIDAVGDSLVINSAGGLTACSSTCTPPTLSNTSVDVTCLGGSDGSIDLTVTGSSTYSYSWSNSATTEDLSGLSAGTYTVTVTDNADATCTATATITINDGTQPTVTANATSQSVCSGDAVTLTGAGANTYIWDNGVTDGAPFNITTTTTYTVTGTDINGCTNTDQITITVNPCTGPTASFTVSPTTTICAGDCIDFTNTSVNVPPGSLIGWNFPGATPATSTTNSPSTICYNNAGTYWATLVISDASFNVIDSTGVAITVNNCSTPDANINISPAGPYCENDCITFSSSSTYAAGATFAWDFGNGQSSTLENPVNSICYTTAGTYTVSLTVTDANGTDTETTTVTITSCTGPTASFNVTPNTTICEGDCIDFTNTSINVPAGSLIGWNFPGATPTTSTTYSPTNVCYNTAGSYWVTLVISDASFNILDSTGIAITVNTCTLPDANIDVTSTGPYCANDCVDFSSSSTFTSPATFLWDFGNGQTANVENPGTSICYATAGTYTVTLTVTDANGSNTETTTVLIENCIPPTAGFTMSNNTICEGDCITFTNQSTDATNYEWTFPGGSPSSNLFATPGEVCFSDSGTYEIQLVSSNLYGSDTSTIILQVNPDPDPITSADMDIISSQTVPIEILNPQGTWTYSWSPTDYLSCSDCYITDASPIDTTQYIVTVTNEYGCTADADVIINVEYIEAIGVPTAFSPNGDGTNDFLFVQGAGIKNMTFRVYNKYGQVVFETTEQNVGWDGTFQGKPLNPGVFVYVVEYDNSTSEDNILKGNVTLVK